MKAVIVDDETKGIEVLRMMLESHCPNVKIIGHPDQRAAIISFIINNIHSHDFGTIANHYGVCVRTGHHCAMPLMDFYKISSTIRLSLGIYNVKTDIDKLIFSIKESQNIFYPK